MSPAACLVFGPAEEARELALCRGAEARDHRCTSLDDYCIGLWRHYIFGLLLTIRSRAYLDQVVHN